MKSVILLLVMLSVTGCGSDRTFVGPQGEQGPAGDQGPAGEDGTPGATGPQGASCTVIQLDNGARIECPDGSFAVIMGGKRCNGKHCD